MRSFYLVGFLSLTLFDTVAQISLKYAADHAMPLEWNISWLLRIIYQPWVYGGLIGYLGAFVVWLTLLRRAPIGPAFAASHLDIVSVLLLSAWLFNEPITVQKALGAIAILAGVFGLGWSETKSYSNISNAK
jgi:drug/metabolite transporter (DMT)-like permease